MSHTHAYKTHGTTLRNDTTARGDTHLPMLGGALFHAALLCGTATVTATEPTHRAQPIAACDKQPTTTECCSRRLSRGNAGSRQKHPPGSDAGQAAAGSGGTAAALARPAIVFCALQRALTLVEHRASSREHMERQTFVPCSVFRHIGQNRDV